MVKWLYLEACFHQEGKNIQVIVTFLTILTFSCNCEFFFMTIKIKKIRNCVHISQFRLLSFFSDFISHYSDLLFSRKSESSQFKLFHKFKFHNSEL